MHQTMPFHQSDVSTQSFHAVVVEGQVLPSSRHPLPKAHLQSMSHLQWCVRAPGSLPFAEQTWLTHVHFVTITSTTRARFSTSNPTYHSQSRTLHSPVESILLQAHAGSLTVNNGSRRSLGSPCIKAFSSSAKNILSDRVVARIATLLMERDNCAQFRGCLGLFPSNANPVTSVHRLSLQRTLTLDTHEADDDSTFF